LVEHVTENHGVGGSIPPLGTTSLSTPEQATAESGWSDLLRGSLRGKIGPRSNPKQALLPDCFLKASRIKKPSKATWPEGG
jgi:hypothetical protein